ncbi:hypothetical protein BHM03_00056568 [Ensete ventricosum]|nr:hypothetical protein BHM03_00056568 [Ensete ventricosum]
MAGEGTPQGIATGRCRAAEHREETDLDGAMVAVMVGETEGAEGAVGAVEAVHVALALVRVGVDRALNEEPRRQKRPQPRRPATVLLRHSTALITVTIEHRPWNAAQCFACSVFQPPHAMANTNKPHLQESDWLLSANSSEVCAIELWYEMKLMRT